MSKGFPWAVAGVLVTAAAPAWAQSGAELDQRLRIIERKLELQAEDSQAKAKVAAVPGAGDKGFSLKSADGAYELKLRALAQVDGRLWLSDDRAPSGNDTFLLRRLRPTFEGSAGKLVGFRLTPEFAGDGTGSAASIVDAYVDLRFNPAASVRVGKQKGPVGLERLQSGGAIAFAERGFPTELVPNRDIGVALFGEFGGGVASYTVGVFNGTADGRDASAPDTDSREAEARVFFEPFRNDPGLLQGLGFGVAGTHGNKASTAALQNAALPRYRSAGQNVFFNYRATAFADGQHARYVPQAYWYAGSFGVLGEFAESAQEVSAPTVGTREFQHQAYQVVASYVLTGEDASFRGVAKPGAPYTAGGDGWGALEVVARHGELDVDDGVFEGGVTSWADPAVAASRARSYGAGFNWILTQNAKIVVDYDETRFLGGAATGNRAKEQIVFTRLQLTY